MEELIRRAKCTLLKACELLDEEMIFPDEFDDSDEDENKKEKH